MSHTLQMTDKQYETIQRAARAQGRTPDALLAQWVNELSRGYDDLPYYETDDWFRHLGVSEERIQRIKAEVAEEEARPDANAQ